MDALGPIWVRESTRNVTHASGERLGRRVRSRRRLGEGLLQDSANPVFSLRRFALCLTLIRALKTDWHATIKQEGFCLAVSALCHDVLLRRLNSTPAGLDCQRSSSTGTRPAFSAMRRVARVRRAGPRA